LHMRTDKKFNTLTKYWYHLYGRTTCCRGNFTAKDTFNLCWTLKDIILPLNSKGKDYVDKAYYLMEREPENFKKMKIRPGSFIDHVPQLYSAILKQILKRRMTDSKE